MSPSEKLSSFEERYALSAEGKYYIDDQCLDCDLCREIAPEVFRRVDSLGRSYVYRQPATPEDVLLVKEALEGCCTEAIHSDGDSFNWDEHPPVSTVCESHNSAQDRRTSKSPSERNLFSRIRRILHPGYWLGK